VNFSRRTSWNREPNRLATRRVELEAAGTALIDLTESNPTRCGLTYAWEPVGRALARREAMAYAPEPLGSAEARRAVAAYYAERGARVDDRHVLLCASTSEAYGVLFKLLCDPADEVLIPAPTYPLLDDLTRLESVQTVAYPLRLTDGWSVDFDALVRAATPKTRAVVVVSPGNPTGVFLKSAELAQLQALCARRGWAFLCDEVFSDYALGADLGRVPTVAGMEAPALTFALSGLSKVAALPQLKLSWVVVSGPPEVRDEALARLELVSDTYLSVSTPVQQALPELLSHAGDLQRQVRERVRVNRARLAAACGPQATWSVLPSEGGWSAVVRTPRTPSEEDLCLALLERGVVVQPGYFYDFTEDGFLVLSLLPPPELFARGAESLARCLETAA
jgi:alanine-synthesizing transaminase